MPDLQPGHVNLVVPRGGSRNVGVLFAERSRAGLHLVTRAVRVVHCEGARLNKGRRFGRGPGVSPRGGDVGAKAPGKSLEFF